MPAHDLQSQLEELRSQLAQDTPLTRGRSAPRSRPSPWISKPAWPMTARPSTPTRSVDGVNLAVERFEVSHPSMAITLRNILQSLANMGI